jgi:uncharacterized protein (DUF169 family)
VKFIPHNWKELSEYLQTRLRLRCSPVAVKLFEDKKEVPHEVEWATKKIELCIMTSMARFQGKAVAADPKTFTCIWALFNLGFTHPTVEEMADRNWAFSWGKQYPRENFQKMFKTMYRLDRNTQAIAVWPLDKAPQDVDVVILFGNSAHMNIIINTYVMQTGVGRLSFAPLGAEGICSDALAAPMVTKQPQLAIPCMGSRVYAGYGDDELTWSFLPEHVNDLIQGLKKSEKNYPLPVPVKLPEWPG